MNKIKKITVPINGVPPYTITGNIVIPYGTIHIVVETSNNIILLEQDFSGGFGGSMQSFFIDDVTLTSICITIEYDRHALIDFINLWLVVTDECGDTTDEFNQIEFDKIECICEEDYHFYRHNTVGIDYERIFSLPCASLNDTVTMYFQTGYVFDHLQIYYIDGGSDVLILDTGPFSNYTSCGLTNGFVGPLQPWGNEYYIDCINMVGCGVANANQVFMIGDLGYGLHPVTQGTNLEDFIFANPSIISDTYVYNSVATPLGGSPQNCPTCTPSITAPTDNNGVGTGWMPHYGSTNDSRFEQLINAVANDVVPTVENGLDMPHNSSSWFCFKMNITEELVGKEFKFVVDGRPCSPEPPYPYQPTTWWGLIWKCDFDPSCDIQATLQGNAVCNENTTLTLNWNIFGDESSLLNATYIITDPNNNELLNGTISTPTVGENGSVPVPSPIEGDYILTVTKEGCPDIVIIHTVTFYNYTITIEIDDDNPCYDTNGQITFTITDDSGTDPIEYEYWLYELPSTLIDEGTTNGNLVIDMNLLTENTSYIINVNYSPSLANFDELVECSDLATLQFSIADWCICDAGDDITVDVCSDAADNDYLYDDSNNTIFDLSVLIGTHDAGGTWTYLSGENPLNVEIGGTPITLNVGDTLSGTILEIDAFVGIGPWSNLVFEYYIHDNCKSQVTFVVSDCGCNATSMITIENSDCDYCVQVTGPIIFDWSAGFLSPEPYFDCNITSTGGAECDNYSVPNNFYFFDTVNPSSSGLELNGYENENINPFGRSGIGFKTVEGDGITGFLTIGSYVGKIRLIRREFPFDGTNDIPFEIDLSSVVYTGGTMTVDDYCDALLAEFINQMSTIPTTNPTGGAQIGLHPFTGDILSNGDNPPGNNFYFQFTSHPATFGLAIDISFLSRHNPQVTWVEIDTNSIPSPSYDLSNTLKYSQGGIVEFFEGGVAERGLVTDYRSRTWSFDCELPCAAGTFQTLRLNAEDMQYGNEENYVPFNRIPRGTDLGGGQFQVTHINPCAGGDLAGCPTFGNRCFCDPICSNGTCDTYQLKVTTTNCTNPTYQWWYCGPNSDCTNTTSCGPNGVNWSTPIGASNTDTLVAHEANSAPDDETHTYKVCITCDNCDPLVEYYEITKPI